MRARQTFPILLLTGLAVAVPALAQVKAGDSLPAACAPDPAKTDRAHETYKIGKTFFDRGDYDKALQYWTDAYGFDCSAHFLLPKIADIWLLKGNKAEALRMLEEYMKRTDGQKDPSVTDLRGAVQVRIDKLRQELASAPAASSAAPPPVTTATAQPSASATAAPTAAPTSTTEPESRGGSTAAPWALIIGGGAMIATGVTLWFVGSSKISSAESNCQNRKCTNPSDVDSGNSGRTLQGVSYVVAPVGLAALITGIVWRAKANNPPTTEAGAHVTPQLGPGYAGVSVGGKF